MKYCKKLFALLAAALLCMALTLPAGAAAPLVRDECGVFDADTLADLEEQAESASDGHDVDVYFLVVDDIGDADQRDYAKNYYISNGLGYGDEQSGILFLLAVGSRKYVTITYGEGVTAFTDYRIEQQEDEIVPELSDEEWADAAYTYIDMCDYALDYYADYGEPIDVDNDIGLEDLLIAITWPRCSRPGSHQRWPGRQRHGSPAPAARGRSAPPPGCAGPVPPGQCAGPRWGGRCSRTAP